MSNNTTPPAPSAVSRCCGAPLFKVNKGPLLKGYECEKCGNIWDALDVEPTTPAPSPADDGGPAFPQTNDAWIGSDGNPPVPSGMTLRDYYAGKATAYEVDRVLSSAQTLPILKGINLHCWAKYQYADAMIAQRKATT